MAWLRLHQDGNGQRIGVACRALKSVAGTDRDAAGTTENVEKRFRRLINVSQVLV